MLQSLYQGLEVYREKDRDQGSDEKRVQTSKQNYNYRGFYTNDSCYYLPCVGEQHVESH